MPNKNVFRGSDATLVLAVDDNSTVEGGLADALINEYEFSNIVGRLSNVTVTVENELSPFHEIGKRFPTELRPGNVNISGFAERAHVNGAMIRFLLGDAATSPPPQGTIPQPSFNIVISMKNPAQPDNSSKITLFGVKLEKLNFQLPEDDFIMESVSFKALRITTSETG